MPSWQSRIASLAIRTLVKRRLHASEDEMVRHWRSKLGKPRLASDSLVEGMTGRPTSVGGISGEWLDWENVFTDRTLLYLHGGGYVACSAETHRPITVALTRYLRCQTFVPDYRLAPEHRFPAAIDDVVQAYRGLLERQIDPKQIVIAGDSAGACLALALLLTLKDAGDEMPAAVACLSPWVDLDGTGTSLNTNNRKDAMFFGQNVREFAQVYLGGSSPRDGRVSPIYADLSGLPPLCIHVSDTEILLDDALRLATRARESGVETDLRVWKGLSHVWQIFAGFVPEADTSLREIAAFLEKYLPQQANRPFVEPTKVA